MKFSRRDLFRKLIGAAGVACLPVPAIAAETGLAIPFKTLPTNMYIRGPRYRVMFTRIVVPRFAVSKPCPWSELQL